MLQFIANYLPAFFTQAFKKPQQEPQHEPNEHQELQCAAERLSRTRPLASSLGSRKGAEISGHWTIRGQEIFLDYKRSGSIEKPEVSQTIKKNLLDTKRAS